MISYEKWKELFFHPTTELKEDLQSMFALDAEKELEAIALDMYDKYVIDHKGA